jgi:ATP-dependent Clp protease protease subunit
MPAPNFWNIVVEGSTAKIHIDGQIGENWFGDGVTSKTFKDEVDALGAVDLIEVHISSAGGNVLDGLAMYHYLKQHQASVATYCDSTAASIASVVFLAGDQDKRHMPKGTTLFVHDPLTWAMGNADKFREIAKDLDGTKDNIVDIYESETRLSRDEISALMTAETTLSAEDAVAKGFASKLLEYDQPIVNSFNADAVRKEVVMSAELHETRTQLASTRSSLADAQNKITDLQGQLNPELMQASDVIAQCKEKGFEGLAINFIETGISKTKLDNQLQMAADVKDLCVAAGIDDPTAVVMLVHNPIEMMRTALNIQAANSSDDVSNHFSPDASPSKGKSKVAQIYENRRKVVHN